MVDAAPLRQGVQALGLDLTEEQIARLLDFLALLQKWNKVYNLTAVRDPQEMLTHHLLDSLAAVAPLRRHLAQQGGAGRRLLDVGSGGGLPGVVFAICCPDLDVSCVDTVAKKAGIHPAGGGRAGPQEPAWHPRARGNAGRPVRRGELPEPSPRCRIS
ncbi:methyltransferase GidB [Alicycliphilus sp. B1]|nr:methyltransferase GidB [Alicycliphilus sp. B1]